MRTRFNLDLATLDEFTLLVHGPYGAGKTHLEGDFLKWASAQGPVRYVNIRGEDGQASLAGMGLGEIGETVDTLEDFDAVLDEFTKTRLIAFAGDGLPALYAAVLKSFVGEVRYPDPKKDGERAKMLWGQMSMAMAHRIKRCRAIAKYVMWVSAYDRSEDPASGGKGITPDLPGKLAWGSAGWFDLVGYLTAETLGPGTVKRKLTFEPMSNILTRQRLPQPLKKAIEIPEGGGGWQRIYDALQTTFTVRGGKQ